MLRVDIPCFWLIFFFSGRYPVILVDIRDYLADMEQVWLIFISKSVQKWLVLPDIVIPIPPKIEISHLKESIMDIQRAQEIVESLPMINVHYHGIPVYIQALDPNNETATVFPLDEMHHSQPVELSGLTEVQLGNEQPGSL